MTALNQKKYLDKIGFVGPVEPSYEALRQIQKKHLFKIPFENLDIHYGKEIKLVPEYFFNKIVNKSRGGFCYELNGLFYELLKSIGFEAYLISAKVNMGKSLFSPEYDHMAIIVKIDGTKHLVDVGFGEFAFEPLTLIDNKVQKDLRTTYKVEKHSATHWRVSHLDANKMWKPEYIFSLGKRKLTDFKSRCNFHQTSEKSHFTNKKICSKPIPGGRITVSGNEIKIKINDTVETKTLITEKDFKRAIKQYFNFQI